MTEYTIASATLEHARAIAAKMRPEDAAEVWASDGWTPEEALVYSMVVSDAPQVALVDGKPICMFGVGQATPFSDVAVPWILTTDDLPGHWVYFLRGSKEWVEDVRQKYPLLVNHVDARYTTAVKWLRWLGFDIGEPEPYGPEGHLFHRAELRS